MNPSDTPRTRVLHVHPTRHCNLACLHCYSSSGPHERRSLDPAILCAAISQAAQLGYQVASFSGGEPMLYPQLPALLQEAHSAGMHTSVVTNGALAGSRAWDTALPLVDTLVLSIDGPPTLHNRIRRSPRAYAALQRAIDDLHRRRQPFGLIHTVTRQSFDQLDWLLIFATQTGARLLQFHPLEHTGRAARSALDVIAPLSAEETLRLYLIANTLALTPSLIDYQVDLIHADTLEQSPGQFFEPYANDQLALPNPLVIEEDATLTPLAYGLDRTLTCGNLLKESLSAALNWAPASAWRRALQQRCEATRVRLLANAEESPVFNWYEELSQNWIASTLNSALLSETPLARLKTQIAQ